MDDVIGFDTIVIIDWSARSTPSPKRPTKDAIFIGVRRGGVETTTYHRTRHGAVAHLVGLFEDEVVAGRRVMAGFDFPFAYPEGFAREITGSDDPMQLWAYLTDAIEDHPNNANNRWDVAEALNARFPGVGPFWGCPAARSNGVLPAKGTARRDHGMTEKRRVEVLLPRAQPCWKLFTTGSVGSQVLLGLPHLQGLRQRFGASLSVSPFEPPDTPIVLAEIYPGLIDADIKSRVQPDEILDSVQVRLLARAFARLPSETLDAILRAGHPEEGWIAGLGHEAALIAGLD